MNGLIAEPTAVERCRFMLREGAQLSADTLAQQVGVGVERLQGQLHAEWFEFVQVAGPDGWLWALRRLLRPSVTRQPGSDADPKKPQDFSHQGERTAFNTVKATAERFGDTLVGEFLKAHPTEEWSISQIAAAVPELHEITVRNAVYHARELGILTRRKGRREGIDLRVLQLYKWGAKP